MVTQLECVNPTPVLNVFLQANCILWNPFECMPAQVTCMTCPSGASTSISSCKEKSADGIRQVLAYTYG